MQQKHRIRDQEAHASNGLHTLNNELLGEFTKYLFFYREKGEREMDATA